MIKLNSNVSTVLPYGRNISLSKKTDRTNLAGMLKRIISRSEKQIEEMDIKDNDKLLAEVKNNLIYAAEVVQKDVTAKSTEERMLSIYGFFIGISVATIERNNYLLEFIFRMMDCLKPWQIGDIGINNLKTLASFYRENEDIVLCRLESLGEKYRWNDFIDNPGYDIIYAMFVRFSIPEIFIRLFYTSNKKEQKWFRHVLVGNNIRSAYGLPIKMTRNASHILGDLKINDDNLTISKSIVYAQLCSGGVSDLYAKEFINSKIYKDWRNFEFWQNVFVFFTKENANPATISNLIDYINGCRLRQGSNFSLKGRTLASMENGMRRWHEDLYAERQRYYYKDIYWEGKNIRDFEMEREEKKYIIKQLISSAELAEESKNLHHCVYSYSGLCENGVASIWSLRIVKEDGSLVERLVTIEERECRLVQIKGSYNRLPNIKEMSIIREWAKSEGLKILLNYF